MIGTFSRRALFVIRLVAMAALVIGQMTLAGWNTASAATGDVIADVVTPEGPVIGKAIAFDGHYLYYTLLNGTVLYRIDVPAPGGPAEATGHTEFAITGAPSGINAMSYDVTRDMFWAAGGDGVSIYLLSKTGVATLRFAIDPAQDRPGDCMWQTCQQEINALAYDGADDSLWYSPDATARVYHYHTSPDATGTADLVQGSPYVDFDVAPNDMDPQCGYSLASGVAVGGEHLFIAGSGCRYLFEYTKTGTKIGWTQWASGNQSPWELACDNLSYGASVFWAKDGFDGHIRAIEQPAGGCAYGGVASVPAVHDLKVTAPAMVTAGQPFSVTITAENAQGNAVPTYSGAVHFATTDPSDLVQLPSDSTLTNGQATFSATLILGETQTLTVSDRANSLSTTVSLPVNAQAATQLWISDSGDPANQNPHVAGTPITFAVQAKDRFGNTDKSYAGTVHFTSSDTFPTTVLPPDSTLSNGSGAFVATLTRAGLQLVAATDTTNASVTGSTVKRIIAGPAANMGIAVPAAVKVNESFFVTVTLKDRFGNVASSYGGTVHFATTDISPLVKLPANYTFTVGDGGARSFSVTLETPPSQTIRVSDVASASLAATSASIAVNLPLP
jgi:hypothetical protein